MSGDLPPTLPRTSLALRCFAALAVAGCGDQPEDPELLADCGGARPSLEECVWYPHDLAADCGGVGDEARMGCLGLSCQWYRGGCVPEGVPASSCTESDPCCVESADGTLAPFDVVVEDDLRRRSAEFLSQTGGSPSEVDRERNLSVIVAPLEPIGSSELTCTPVDSEQSGFDVCDCLSRTWGQQRWADADAFYVRLRSCATGLGDDLWIDVTRDDVGAMRARACLRRNGDPGAHDFCDVDQPLCATSGTVTIEEFPVLVEVDHADFPIAPEIRFDIDVILEDGRHLQGRFAPLVDR